MSKLSALKARVEKLEAAISKKHWISVSYDSNSKKKVLIGFLSEGNVLKFTDYVDRLTDYTAFSVDNYGNSTLDEAKKYFNPGVVGVLDGGPNSEALITQVKKLLDKSRALGATLKQVKVKDLKPGMFVVHPSGKKQEVIENPKPTHQGYFSVECKPDKKFESDSIIKHGTDTVTALGNIVQAYLEIGRHDITDPNGLLKKCNKYLGSSLTVNSLPSNWGFRHGDFKEEGSIYTSSNVRGKFDDSFQSHIDLYGHQGDKPAPSGSGNMLIIDRVRIGNKLNKKIKGIDEPYDIE